MCTCQHHLCELTVMLGGGVSGNLAAGSETTVPVCASTSVCMKLLDVCGDRTRYLNHVTISSLMNQLVFLPKPHQLRTEAKEA